MPVKHSSRDDHYAFKYVKSEAPESDMNWRCKFFTFWKWNITLYKKSVQLNKLL